MVSRFRFVNRIPQISINPCFRLVLCLSIAHIRQALQSGSTVKIQPELLTTEIYMLFFGSAENGEVKKAVSIFYKIFNHEQQELLSGIYDREHHIIMAQWRHTRI